MGKKNVLLHIITLAFCLLTACNSNSNTPSGSGNSSSTSEIPIDNRAEDDPFYSWKSESYKNEMGGYSFMYSPQFGIVRESKKEIMMINTSGKSFFDVYVWEGSIPLEKITEEWFINDCITNLGFKDVNILTYDIKEYSGYECLDITCTWTETHLGKKMTFSICERYIHTDHALYELVCRDGSDNHVYMSTPYENFASYFEYTINNFTIN